MINFGGLVTVGSEIPGQVVLSCVRNQAPISISEKRGHVFEGELGGVFNNVWR